MGFSFLYLIIAMWVCFLIFFRPKSYIFVTPAFIMLTTSLLLLIGKYQKALETSFVFLAVSLISSIYVLIHENK